MCCYIQILATKDPADVMAHGLGPALCSHLAFKRFSVLLKCCGLSLPPGNFLLIPEKKKFPLPLFEHLLPGGTIRTTKRRERGSLPDGNRRDSVMFF